VSPEAQRIAIAEACGFTQEKPWLDGRECWGHKDHPPHVGFEEIPDYLNDLNAMAGAENTLTDNQWFEYDLQLMLVAKCDWHVPRNRIRATAAQRAEAYLRAINLWQESPPTTP
jgi:hypothetical protein